jgi:hypothetical protein
VPVLVITGPVGVGKTSVAGEVSERLSRAGVAHAWVDADVLRRYYPRPPTDPRGEQVGLRNLAALWANFRAAGAARLVLADVVESPADVARVGDAIPGAVPLVVRLRATPATLTVRVGQRETGSAFEPHLRHALALAAAPERDGVGDLVVETDGRSVSEVATEVLLRSRWLGPTEGPAVARGDP